ncbi:MAG TPA: cation:proton antiporter [Pseudonocardiaceae bacterium]|jgi:Kef-type K+ transport system membrane component KefB|nr:cation:proton antiporter [Pseudonocardiaceae bacterium]
MSLHSADLAHFFLAVALLLVLAHVLGSAFALLRQPRVIGEILGGLLLGPTVLGLVAPRAQAALLPGTGAAGAGLGVLSELGLLLLMFLSGREVLAYRSTGPQRTVLTVTLTGLALPLAGGLAAAQLVNYTGFVGAHGNRTTFALVFGMGVAVTSIPVISRIMLDLGILHTRFARVTLSVAVLEDVVLYVAVAVILGLAGSSSGAVFGLWSLFHNPSTTATTLYYVLASLVFLGVFMPLGRPIFAALANSRLNLIERRSPAAFRLIFLLLLVLACIFLGINPIFGAVLAGASAAGADNRCADKARWAEAERSWDAIKRFSLALFVPLYFAVVGVQLDLVHHFPVLFFMGFLVLGCVAKAVSVWLGARLAGESNRESTHLAVALNARGGPGIVLATVTLSAGVINEDFFTTLVVLSIVTSQFAGLWLQHAFVPELAAAQSGGDHADATPAGRSQPVQRAGSRPDAGAP